MNPKNTIFGALRLFCRKFSDVQNDIAHCAVKVKAGSEGSPVFVVQSGGTTVEVTPEDVIIKVLEKMCVASAPSLRDSLAVPNPLLLCCASERVIFLPPAGKRLLRHGWAARSNMSCSPCLRCAAGSTMLRCVLSRRVQACTF